MFLNVLSLLNRNGAVATTPFLRHTNQCDSSLSIETFSCEGVDEADLLLCTLIQEWLNSLPEHLDDVVIVNTDNLKSSVDVGALQTVKYLLKSIHIEAIVPETLHIKDPNVVIEVWRHHRENVV